MRWLKIICFSFLALVFQTAFFTPLTVYHIKPDLLIILLVILALEKGPDFGAIYGLIAGIGMDLVGGGVLGSNALAKTLVGAGVGTLNQFVFEENIFLRGLLVFAVSLLHDLVIYLIYLLLPSAQISTSNFFLISLPAALYNMFLAFLFISFWRRIKKS